jgi:cytochrome c oxidase subunit 2
LEFATANELHIPESSEHQIRATRLTIKAGDVCHSFWVPRLAGKMDAIPGRTNTLWLETDAPGLYLGQCAEYCGTQHAHMLIRVIVETPADFERWLENQARPAVEEPSAAEGRRAFLSETCVNCHRVRGTSAAGNYAPDLTHLMSRQTFAGAILRLDRDHLDAWVRNPQSAKPGCLMPAFGLADERRQLIVDYLLTLR